MINPLTVMGLSLIAVAILLFAGVGVYVFVIASLPLAQSFAIWLGLLIPLGLQAFFGVVMLKRSRHEL